MTTVPTKAVILAAGQGQRLKPLTNDRPKGMVEVAGLTIIERQLQLFRRVGIDDVSIVKGFCAGAVPAVASRHYVNEHYETTNMVVSLFCAQDEFNSGGSIIVSYGDILYSEAVLRRLLASQAAVSVVVDLDWRRYFAQRFDNPYEDAESLVMAEDGSIRSIGQRNPAAADVQGQYIGLVKFDAAATPMLRRLRQELEGTRTPIGWGRPWGSAYMTDLLQELITRDLPVKAVPIYGEWCEIDSLRDHEIAERVAQSLFA